MNNINDKKNIKIKYEIFKNIDGGKRQSIYSIDCIKYMQNNLETYPNLKSTDVIFKDKTTKSTKSISSDESSDFIKKNSSDEYIRKGSYIYNDFMKNESEN